jgi:hypothetical protein
MDWGGGPGPGYFGCTFIRPGTVMTVEGEDPGGAPMVSALLPDGRQVRGVTLRGMVETFVPLSRKAAVGPNKPAPVQPDGAGKTAGGGAAKTGPKNSIPLPAIQNSVDTLCEAQRQCNEQEFATRLALMQKRWAAMPDSLRKKCAERSTLPAMQQCIVTETTSWSNAHPKADTPWMNPEYVSE